jgi:cytochrome c oxidase subunit 1
MLAMAGGVILFLGAYLWSLEGPGGYHVHAEDEKTQ